MWKKLWLMIGYCIGLGIGLAIQVGVLGAVLYHLNKLIQWIELGSKEMTLGEAFGLAFIAIITVEILLRLTGRK